MTTGLSGEVKRYQANAFYQDGECNCVCDQDDSRRRHPAVKTGPKPVHETLDTAKVITSFDRRDLGESCSNDYDYWTLTCPLKSNDYLQATMQIPSIRTDSVIVYAIEIVREAVTQ
eukprot:Awhi_evm1s3945